MNARFFVADCLASLGQKLGETLELDSAGNCLLEKESGIDCLISTDEFSGGFSLRTALAPLTTDSREFLVDLLVLNNDPDNTFGATIGLDRDANVITLQYMGDVDGLSPDDFGMLLSEFIEQAEVLQMQVLDLQTRSIDERAASLPSSNELPSQNVLRP